MVCIFCHAKMVLATESRGFKTYRCSRGCADYQYEEIGVLAAEPTTSNGITPVGQTETGASAQIAVTT